MIDIIIACYNSHDTIDQCIGSLLMQNTRDFKVTLVNDGGKSYSDVINRYKDLINIQELYYKDNRGPGYARNFGLNNTKEDLIMFMDADDCLCSPFILSTLKGAFIKPDLAVLVSTILKENEDGSVKRIKANRNYNHAKVYRRSFLEHYKIRFKECNCCEDAGFNLLCFCLSNSKEQIQCVDLETYAWLYNKGSLGRRNVEEWEYCTVPRGVVDNWLYTFSELEKRGIETPQILKEKAIALIHGVIMNLHNNEHYPQYKKQNDECLDIVRKEIYLPNKDKITDELFNEAYDFLHLPKEEKVKNMNIIKDVLTTI